MHRHKWNLTIQGLKKLAQGDEADTRRACVNLAKSRLGIPNVSAFAFSPYHRISEKGNAGIISYHTRQQDNSTCME